MNIRPLNNNVLLKVKQDPSKIMFKNGAMIHVDTSFEKEKHSAVICEVVAVPERLIFGFTGDFNKHGKPNQLVNSMDWETDMELRVGDEVIINYMGYVSAFGDDPKHFEIDEVEYFFCDYSLIYLAKRRWDKNDEKYFWEENRKEDITKDELENNNIVINEEKIYNVVMLNGYCLVQPVEQQYQSSTLIIPDYLKKVSNKKKVRVCYNGSNNKRYGADIYQDADVKAGDIVVIDKYTDIPLEYTETFNGKEKYWRVQKCLVQAKLN